jgi:hypothetical protein
MASSRVANKLPSQFGAILLASYVGVNLNAGTNVDLQITLPDTPTKFRVRAIAVTNASINPTTARYAIWTAPGGTGTNIVTTVTPSMATAPVVTDLSIASTAAISGVGNLYLYLTTPQGAAATMDIYIYGDILTA